MAFCANCGTQMQDGAKFCPSCGTAAGTAPVQQPQAPQTPYAPPQPGYQPPVMPGAPTQSSIQDAQDGKGMAIVAYLLFFIPLLTGAHKTSPFVKYHTNQGTVLFLGCIAWGILYGILNAIVTAIFLRAATWGLWSLLTTVLSILWLAPTILCVVGILNAAGGKMKPLPVIGGVSILK